MSSGMFAGTAWDREPHCERCDQVESACTCPPMESQPTWIPPEKQTARLSVEKRAKGKVATIVRGLDPTESDLVALLKQLKTTVGAGGTISDATIEVQGDQLERVRKALGALGYRVKG